MIKNYFKIAWRNLAKNKAYGLINVTGIALSMTCGILIFTLVKFHLSFDDFHKNSGNVYRFVTEQHRDNISYTSGVPPAFGKAFRNDYAFGEKVGRIAKFENELITIKSGSVVKKFNETEGIAFTETEYFDIFNYPLIQGNKAAVLTEPNTAIITERIAKKYFGTENPINKTLNLGNKIDLKITGILDDLPGNTDQKTEIYASWPTLKIYNDWFAADDSWAGISSNLQCFVRLKPNISPGRVEQFLPAYVTKYRPTNKNVHHYKLQPLAQVHFDSRYGGVMEKKNLWVLSFIGLFLIITACVNFINLATAQALKRSKEIGVRKVLGSFPAQVFWQFISETGVITIIAATIAMGLSFLLLPYVNQLFHTQISIITLTNWQLLLFIPCLILLVTFCAGFYPGLIIAGFQPIAALRGKLSQKSIGGFNTRRTLIITQFTISMVLIIGMIVIARQMQYAKQSDLGFNKDAVVMIPVGADSATDVTLGTFANKVKELTGVQHVSICFAAPSADENWNTSVRYDNRTEDELFRVTVKAADDKYVPTFDLKLAAGRNIFPSDTIREMLVNETFARKLNLRSPEEVIGKKLVFDGRSAPMPIVGVLKDFHDRSFHEDINAVCITTFPDNYSNYAVKINLQNVGTVLPALEKEWSNLHPDKLYEYQFLDERIAAFYETEDTMLKLVQFFSLIAIFIGCLGLYGLVAFMVAQKTKEIGIRKVLGSEVVQILWIFGKEFSRLILIAALIAAPFAWWLMKIWLQDFKYHIQMSAWIFALAISLTFFVAVITVGFQSIRAALMNPVKSLKSE
jgi:putative ABC transport system permease protein